MKYKSLLATLLLACTPLLSGCFTKMLWNDELLKESATETKTKDKIFAQDNVIGFGQIQSSKQMLMVGEKYLFLFSEKSSQDWQQAIMDLHLTNSFSLQEPLTIHLAQQQQSWQWQINSLELVYRPANAQEKKAILAMSKQHKIKYNLYTTLLDDGRFLFYFDSPTGTLHSKDKPINFATTSQMQVPATLYIQEKYTAVNDNVVKTKMILTPLALVGDIIAIPVVAILGIKKSF